MLSARRFSTAAAVLLAGCFHAAPVQTRQAGDPASDLSMADALRIADTYRVAAINNRRIPHNEYWAAVRPSLSSPRLHVESIGKSLLGRELRSVTFGSGPVKVLLWSQMHGDEATATMALADIMAWMAAPGTDRVRDRLASSLTIVMVPMLNPDGAERFQRHNAAGIDVNRDARMLSTPEARALKAVHERLHPEFGFNLHDQNARTRVGDTGLQAAIAILAPATEKTRSWSPQRVRARLVAAGLSRDFDSQAPGRVSKYDDTFNPRAFGDLMASWGTSTVLIESGAMPNDPDKQALRRLNTASILRALDAIATRRFERNDPADYENLLYNTSGAYDLLVRGGTLVLPGMQPVLADVAINFDDPVARTGGRVREIGDLFQAVAVDTLDARGLYLHARPDALTMTAGKSYLTTGARAAFDIREGANPGSALRQRMD